jgi:hypothetical protein
VHWSLDEGKMDGTSVFDFLSLRSDPAHHDIDFMWYDSVVVPRSDREFDMSHTASVIARLVDEQIRIYAIVGDGLSSQIQRLNP